MIPKTTATLSGGSAFTEILKSRLARVATISALVRRLNQAAILQRTVRVIPILFKGLNDLAALEEVASESNVVINGANGLHSASAVTLILQWPAEAQGEDGKKKAVHLTQVRTATAISYQTTSPHCSPLLSLSLSSPIACGTATLNHSATPVDCYMQTSGASNLNDSRISGAYTKTRIFTDHDHDHDHIHTHEKILQAHDALLPAHN
ncbi:hypothetical protein BJX64DRAFT_291877 [Aspergillus heterothallicus]